MQDKSNQAATIRLFEAILTQVLTFGLPLFIAYLENNPKWIGLVPILEAIVAFMKQKGFLPTNLTVK